MLGAFDDYHGDVLKGFEQTLGCRAIRFALGVARIKPRQFGPLCRSLTADDKFEQC